MSDKSDFGKKIKQLEARIVQLEKSKGNTKGRMPLPMSGCSGSL